MTPTTPTAADWADEYSRAEIEALMSGGMVGPSLHERWAASLRTAEQRGAEPDGDRLTFRIVYDADSGYWVALSGTLRGMALQAKTIEELGRKCDGAVPVLVKYNHDGALGGFASPAAPVTAQPEDTR